jgi:hypothetical protein
MIDTARRLAPELTIFFGLEWNAPLSVHANLIFPPGPNEAENAYAFARAHDRLGSQREPTPEEALASLAELPAAERPVLFFNHPATGQWSSATIARYLHADSAGLIVGIEPYTGISCTPKSPRSIPMPIQAVPSVVSATRPMPSIAPLPY